jgi:predicted metalloprotease with PDZ domain
MHAAFEQFSGDRGFTPDAFKATAAKVAGAPLDDFFRRTVESTEELDYTEALDWFGLRFRQEAQPAGKPGPPKAWMGVETRADNGRLIVRTVPRETPAYDSGLSVDDEIVAIDDFRVRPDQIAQRLENYRPGDKVTILVSRRDRLMRVPLTLGEEPKKWQLEIRPDATESQKRNLESWMAK